ncbi:MAG: flavodoxin family protein [Lachnospiraceae bacterium]|nr:flavodoxin family protein [Lachnospiraceae bacterium]
MKKVTAIVGSPQKCNSSTYKTVVDIMNSITSNDPQYKKNIISLSHYNIQNCKGCARCFATCSICQQFEDDIRQIEEELLMSEVIILASPVYAHNITGIMKNFIDRIAYGLHVMRFAGKYGVTVSVSYSNGNSFVDGYLSKILMYLGVKVIQNISVQRVKTVDQNIISECGKQIANVIDGTGGRKSTEYEELVFQTMKKALLNVSERLETNETRYWKARGFFECDSFEEVFEREKNRLDNNI